MEWRVGLNGWVVLEWAESYQISVALRLGGFDILEGGFGGGERTGEEKEKSSSKDLHIFIVNKNKLRRRKGRSSRRRDEFLEFHMMMKAEE